MVKPCQTSLNQDVNTKHRDNRGPARGGGEGGRWGGGGGSLNHNPYHHLEETVKYWAETVLLFCPGLFLGNTENLKDEFVKCCRLGIFFKIFKIFVSIFNIFSIQRGQN